MNDDEDNMLMVMAIRFDTKHSSASKVYVEDKYHYLAVLDMKN